jgi:hypothetical protein
VEGENVDWKKQYCYEFERTTGKQCSIIAKQGGWYSIIVGKVTYGVRTKKEIIAYIENLRKRPGHTPNLE